MSPKKAKTSPSKAGKDKQTKDKPPDIPSDEIHQAIIEVLEHQAPPQRYMNKAQKAAQKKVNRNHLTLEREQFDPLVGAKTVCVMFGKLILPKESDVKNIIKMYIDETSYENAKKLHAKIKNVYAGISQKAIQTVISEDPLHAKVAPKFLNKPKSRPIEAERPMEINQADLVDMRSYPVTQDNKTYRFILSVIDVFSRFVWLIPLERKDAASVAQELYNIYITFDSPIRLQTDQGTEFKSEVQLLCSLLNARIIYSRAHHPQSQGIIERSHGTWKNKIKHDMIAKAKEENPEYSWVDYLPGYARAYNEGFHRNLGFSPFEVFFGRASNRLARFRPQRDEEESITEEEVSYESEVDLEKMQEMLDQHEEAIKFFREKAKEKSAKQSNIQTQKLLHKRIPTLYDVGDLVLVEAKQPGAGRIREGKKLSKQRAKEGEVIEADPDNFRYKVHLYEDETEAWYNVEYLSMRTPAEEKKKQKQQKEAKSKIPVMKECKCSNKNCMRTPARECSYGMHRLCCRDFIKKKGACAIDNHNNPGQAWADYSTLYKKQQKDKERTFYEEAQRSTWLLDGFEAFVSMQAWLLASFKKDPQTRLSKSKTKKKKQTQSNNLEEKASKKGLVVKDCGGGGECFFSSISDQMQIRLGISISPKEIRKNAVEYLIKNPTFAAGQHLGAFVDLSDKLIEELHQQGLYEETGETEKSEGWDEAALALYAREMRKTTTWADHIIIMATVECLQYDLSIVSANLGQVDALIRFTGSDGHGLRLTVGHVWEMHYVSLQPVETEALPQKRKHEESDDDEEQQEEAGEPPEKIIIKEEEEEPEQQEEEEELVTPVVKQYSYEDVENFFISIANEFLERGTDIDDPEDPLLNVQPGMTPLHLDNSIAAKLFMQDEGVAYEVIHTSKGSFALLDEDGMERFDEFQTQIPKNTLVLTTPAFFYYLAQRWESGTVRQMKRWTDEIWEVDIDFLNAYTLWFNTEKEKWIRKLQE